VVKITFLSDKASWKNEAIDLLVKKLRKNQHKVTFLHKAEAVPVGDILFILGFFKIVPRAVLSRNRMNLVVHESALPKGRGWSPVTWLVLEGAKAIPLTLFEAVERVDAGKIFLRDKVKLRGDELLPEIQTKVAANIMRLCERFVASYPAILRRGVEQRGKATYYPRRKPEDSRLDPKKSIANQFNLLRTVKNDVYPAYFKLRGSTYLLKIEKKKD
jgi:methionyl-tRNA formyltransferase